MATGHATAIRFGPFSAMTSPEPAHPAPASPAPGVPDAAALRRAALMRIVPPLLFLAVGTVMAWWTWGTWPDVIIDFGRELYVPWQLAQGKVLYRDIAYFNGPLSPYFNAIAFRLFGASLLTLVVVNLAIVALIVFMLYRLLRRVEHRPAAAVGVLAFLLLFAFNRYEWVGNSNYICPYSHETTHGVALCLLLLLLLVRFVRTAGRAWLLASGLTLGLLALTKVEICVAAAVTAFAGVALHAWSTRRSAAVAGLDLLALLAPMALPFAVAVGLLSLAMPAHDALLNTLGSWRYAFNSRLSTLLYFKVGTGLLDPVNSLTRMGIAAVGFAGLLALLIVLGRVVAARRINAAPGAAAGFVLAAGLLGAGWKVIPWLDLARPLPLAMMLLLAFAATKLVRSRDDAKARSEAIVAAMLALFGLTMLLKMILFARVSNYGYFLAMPAATLAVSALVGRLPDWLGLRGVSPQVVRAGLAGALLVTLAWHLALVHYHVGQLTVRVGKGANAFYSGGRGQTVNTILDLLATLPPDQTVAVMPEGAMINFLARRANPSPYIIFMPSDLLMFGEGRVISGLDAHPPDYILLAHKDTSEYGYTFFGRDYALSLLDWVRRNYLPLTGAGSEPFKERDKFGILVARRRPGVR